MADMMPDYLVSIQKLKFEISQLETRIVGRKLELLELVSRRDNTLSNWISELSAIEQKQKTLADLEKAHGAVSDKMIEDAKTTNLTKEPEDK